MPNHQVKSLSTFILFFSTQKFAKQRTHSGTSNSPAHHAQVLHQIFLRTGISPGQNPFDKYYTMWTTWHSPLSLTQLETNQINYTDGAGALDRTQDITTIKPVVGNSRTGGGLITTESNSVLFSQFGFQVNSASVQQVEIRLSVARLSRIQDKLIQLYYVTPQGDNLADLTAEDIHVYNTLALPNIDYTSVAFGCVIDLAPHKHYPSSNNIVIRSVSMRLWV